MPAERLPMRRIKEIIRLSWGCGLSARQVARSTVGEYLRRARAAGLSWPLPGELDEETLERKLFSALPYIPASERPLPNWAEVHQELSHKGVTLLLLWAEHKVRYPGLPASPLAGLPVVSWTDEAG